MESDREELESSMLDLLKDSKTGPVLKSFYKEDTLACYPLAGSLLSSESPLCGVGNGGTLRWTWHVCADVLTNSEGWRGVLRTHKDSEERGQTQGKAYTSTFWRGKDARDSPGRMNVQEANLAGAKLKTFCTRRLPAEQCKNPTLVLDGS